jgi:hypothetical protein
MSLRFSKALVVLAVLAVGDLEARQPVAPEGQDPPSAADCRSMGCAPAACSLPGTPSVCFSGAGGSRCCPGTRPRRSSSGDRASKSCTPTESGNAVLCDDGQTYVRQDVRAMPDELESFVRPPAGSATTPLRAPGGVRHSK